MTDITDTDLQGQADRAFAAYMRRVGRPRAMEWLRTMLVNCYAAQQVSDEATGADDHWKRLGAEARKLADEVLQTEETPRRAAE
jgi:hypothetical protein